MLKALTASLASELATLRIEKSNRVRTAVRAYERAVLGVVVTVGKSFASVVSKNVASRKCAFKGVCLEVSELELAVFLSDLGESRII